MNQQRIDFGSLWQQSVLIWRLFKDPETPLWLKLMPIAALIYAVIPEGWAFLPLITPVDDIAILYVAMKSFINMAPPHLVAKHQEIMAGRTVDGKIIEGEIVRPIDKELNESIRINLKK